MSFSWRIASKCSCQTVSNKMRNFCSGAAIFTYFFFFTDSCPTQDFPCLETQPLTSSVSMTNLEFNSVEVRIHEIIKKKRIILYFFFQQIILHLILKLWPASMKNPLMLPDLPQVLLDPHHFKNVTKIRYLLLLKINCSWSCFSKKKGRVFRLTKLCIDHKLNVIGSH